MYKAIVSGHIFLDENDAKDLEILTLVHNDDKGTEIFCDIDDALIDNIDIGTSEDYYFIAVIESKFTKYDTWEGTEYDTEHHVKEIKTVNDLSE